MISLNKITVNVHFNVKLVIQCYNVIVISVKSGNVVTQTPFIDPSLTEFFKNYDGKICHQIRTFISQRQLTLR